MKSLATFLLLWMYLIGTIGGIGYTLMCGEYFIAIAVVVLAGMAFPTAMSLWKKNLEG